MADVVTLPVIRIERQNEDPSFVVTEAMVEAVARARCKREGGNPDWPVHYQQSGESRYRRDPIHRDYIGSRREDGSVTEQWPTMPAWQWGYEAGARADLEVASALTSHKDISS